MSGTRPVSKFGSSSYVLVSTSGVYSPITGHFVTEGEACVILRAIDWHITVGYPVRWDFSAFPDKFVGLNADLRQHWVTMDGWGDVVDAEAEQFGEEDESVVKFLVEPREMTRVEHLKAMREYLRCVTEVPESVFPGGYDALVVYLHGHLH